MNKYQEYILRGYLDQDFIFSRCCPLANEVEGSRIRYGKFDKDTDTFTITQDEDINIVEYSLLIILENNVEKQSIEDVFVFANDKWKRIEKSHDSRQYFPIYRIIIDFNNRIEKIKLSFKNGLTDDYILNLKYVEADKDKYLAKQAQLQKDNLLKAACISHSTGNDLVNIYFKPCCDEYVYTEITLYKDEQMLAKYKVENGVYFKSISGLAYGRYKYVVQQYGNNNKLLIETDKREFSLSSPNFGGWKCG